ncbi:MAG: hypothetical protein QG588_1059 [Candidatus Poribacteria bacterium]|nr:hypothetical protein [Candidatus Poribacteria bacterium]
MKIGLYVTQAMYQPAGFDMVSAHVQIPLYTARILKDLGHDITLITTEANIDRRLPDSLVSVDGIKIKTVTCASRQWPKAEIYPLKSVKQFKEIRKLINSSKFDVINFFGGNKMGYLLGLLKVCGIKTPAFMTFINFFKPHTRLQKALCARLLSNINYIIALTEYTKTQIIDIGLDEAQVKIIKPGIVKQISNINTESKLLKSLKPYILFWRNANWANGADICAEVFKILSCSYPNFNFVYAVRLGDQYENELLNTAKMYKNIHLLKYPYDDNLRIIDLISASFFVILPFRQLSINPQFAVLETLACGTPLITTPIESNQEIITDNKNGIFISNSINEIVAKVKFILDNPSYLDGIGINGKLSVEKDWNWSVYTKELISYYNSSLTN